MYSFCYRDILTTSCCEYRNSLTEGRPVERGRGKVFPATFGSPTVAKTTEKGVPDGFLLTSNRHKIHSWES